MNKTTVFRGPIATQLFSMRAARSAIKLESLGMKHSRGSVRKHWAILLGLRANASHQAVMDAIDAKTNELVAQLNPGDIS